MRYGKCVQKTLQKRPTYFKRDLQKRPTEYRDVSVEAEVRFIGVGLLFRLFSHLQVSFLHMGGPFVEAEVL